MSAPHVWMVNHYAITPDQPGGTRHYDLAKSLVERGFCVTIFASAVNLSLRKAVRLRDGELSGRETVDGIDFVWIRSREYERNDWRRGANMLSFARNFLRVAGALGGDDRPDVVVGSSPHPFAALAASQVARRAKVPFVLEVRDLWPQALVDMRGLSAWHPLVLALRTIERRLYARAERIIILARGSRPYLEARGIPSERIVFVPNGVDIGHFRTRHDREAVRRKLGFSRFTIAYTGAHGPANSHETTLEAAKLLADTPVDFALVGDGPSKAALVRKAQDEGMDNVRFLAPVPKAEIPDLLAAADACLITLLNAKAFAYGISPNKLFDYMAAERPVLCAVPGEMADLVREAGAGFAIPPEDPRALAAAVRTLLALPEKERAALGVAGRRFVEGHYDRRRLADDLSGALRAVLRPG